MSESEESQSECELEYEEGMAPNFLGSGPVILEDKTVEHYEDDDYTSSESESDEEERKRKKLRSCKRAQERSESESVSESESGSESDVPYSEKPLYAKVGATVDPPASKKKKKKKKKKDPQKAIAELASKKKMPLSIGSFIGCRSSKKNRGVYEFSYNFSVEETMDSMAENSTVSMSPTTLLNLSLDHRVMRKYPICDHTPRFQIVGCPKIEYMYNEFPCFVGFTFDHMYGKKLFFGSTPIHGILPPNVNQVTEENDVSTPLYIGHDIKVKGGDKHKFFASLDPKKIDALFKPSQRTEGEKVFLFEYGSPIGEKIRKHVLENNYCGFKMGFGPKSAGGAADEDYKRIGMSSGDVDLFKKRLFGDIKRARNCNMNKIVIKFHKLSCRERKAIKWASEEDMMDGKMKICVQFKFKIKFV